MRVAPWLAATPDRRSAASASRSPLLSSSAHRARARAELSSASPGRMTRSFWLESSAHLQSPLGIVPPVSPSLAMAPAHRLTPHSLRHVWGATRLATRWLQVHNFLGPVGLG